MSKQSLVIVLLLAVTSTVEHCKKLSVRITTSSSLQSRQCTRLSCRRHAGMPRRVAAQRSMSSAGPISYLAICR